MGSRLAFDGDALGFRDALAELLRRGQQRSAIVSLPQDRPDAAQNAAGVSIRNDRFQPVADLDAILVVLDRQQHQQAFVGSLFADAPFLEQADGDVLDRLVFERIHRDDGELRAGGALHVAAIGFDLRRGSRASIT